MVHLPFRRRPASLCGPVARHCPDNGARKQALCAQRPFGSQGCDRIVPQPGTLAAVLHAAGEPTDFRLDRQASAQLSW
jgi:hypothetical protein